MLMTGMSSMGIDGAVTQMMQAKNNLKMMNHQQTTLQARLIKLNKEEERAQKRIRDAERKA
jgi:sensor histidine kinase YesM